MFLKVEQFRHFELFKIIFVCLKILRSVTVEVPETLVNGRLSVYDINGSLVVEQSIVEEKSEIDLSGLAKGTYFVKFVKDGSSVMKQIVKQ